MQERVAEANPRRNLTAEEAKRLTKLEAIAEKLQRGENVQNRKLQTWLSEEEWDVAYKRRVLSVAVSRKKKVAVDAIKSVFNGVFPS